MPQLFAQFARDLVRAIRPVATPSTSDILRDMQEVAASRDRYTALNRRMMRLWSQLSGRPLVSVGAEGGEQYETRATLSASRYLNAQPTTQMLLCDCVDQLVHTGVDAIHSIRRHDGTPVAAVLPMIRMAAIADSLGQPHFAITLVIDYWF